MDSMTSQKRSDLMRRIRTTATAPEMTVRKIVYGMGYRYRANVRGLPGSPDLAFYKLRKAIFVHGCFWHRHRGCVRCTIPKTRRKFWDLKFKANLARDKRKRRQIV